MSSDRYPVSRENHRGMVLIVVVVCILFTALAIKCRSLADRNDTYAQQIEMLEQKIQSERDARDAQKHQREREMAETVIRRKGDLLCIPISQMGLSVQTFNALHRGGVEMSTDLFTLCTQGTIYKVRNIGRRNLEECIEKLRRIGYRI